MIFSGRRGRNESKTQKEKVLAEAVRKSVRRASGVTGKKNPDRIVIDIRRVGDDKRLGLGASHLERKHSVNDICFAGVSFLYDRIKSIATNCLFGIRGAKFQLFPTIAGILTSLVGSYNPLRFGSGLEPFSVIRNGLVTWEFQMAISWILLLASLFITLFYIIHERKTKTRPDNSEEDD